MKTQAQLEEGIKALRKQLKNNLLPKPAKAKIQESIAILEWVLE